MTKMERMILILPSLLLDVIFSTLLLLKKSFTESSNCLILTNQDSFSWKKWWNYLEPCISMKEWTQTCNRASLCHICIPDGMFARSKSSEDSQNRILEIPTILRCFWIINKKGSNILICIFTLNSPIIFQDIFICDSPLVNSLNIKTIYWGSNMISYWQHR